MTKKIFHSILITSVVVLLTGLLIASGSLYHYFMKAQNRQLQDVLRLAALGVEENGRSYLDKLDKGKLRFTWIHADGTVSFDSSADSSQMENHGGREEIREAFATGIGSSERYSSTLTEKTIYYAVKLSDGTVLRVSVSQDTVLRLIFGLAPLLLAAAAFAAVLSWLLAKGLSRRIVTPLNEVDLDHPLENDTYEELSPLLTRIYHQHQQICGQLVQLQKKTDEFNHITESMKEGLILLDGRSCILSINPAAAALFEVQESVIGKEFLTVERSHDLGEAIAAARRTGHKQLRKERHGKTWQFDISRIGADKEAVGLVILAFDVSEQEYAERSRREFTANVSHELKTPLTSIIGSADLIGNNLVKTEDMPRFIGHIRKEAARLLDLIEDIIRLSQLDEGEQLHCEQVDLAEIAGEALSQLCDVAAGNQVTLKLDASPCPLTSVPRMLHEIVYNLTENAIKYNVPGGKVTVTVSPSERGVRLQVIDTGIGIPAEHRDRIFERFYRVDKSHSKASGGTGLGLSIVKHAVQDLGADLELQSMPGKGTAITVFFPIEEITTP